MTRKKEQAGESFSIIVIPDTQRITSFHPSIFKEMTNWIVEQAKALNLKMVLHVGDVVRIGAEEEEDFQNAKAALDVIFNSDIPFLIAPGNHDYDNQVRRDRSLTLFNAYFGMEHYEDKAWFGGTYVDGQVENIYATLEINGRKFIFIALEFGPREEVVAWAEELLQQHDDHEAVILTHSYMYMYGERTKPGDEHNPKIYPGATGAYDGEDLWRELIKKHRNVTAVYSGHHVHEHVSYRMDKGDEGNLVFQSFQNWQSAENGGEGRIRILTYHSKQNKIDLSVYNPHSGEYEENPGYKLSIPSKGRHRGPPIPAEEWESIKYP